MRDVRDAFRNAGLRHTRQREAVYVALAATESHPTAEELHELVRQEESELSLATVYNTLEALCAAGLCRRLPNASGTGRYDADVSDHVHVLLPDGRVLDVPGEVGRRMLASIPADLTAEVERRIGAPLAGFGLQIVAFPGPQAGDASVSAE